MQFHVLLYINTLFPLCIYTYVGIANGISFIHAQRALHNDLKCDNIVLSDHIPQGNGKKQKVKLWPTIIDFSKACPEEDGKKYHLLPNHREEYKSRYSHIAPDLIDGRVTQSVFSDVYSFGRVIHKMAALSDSAKTLALLAAQSSSYADNERQELKLTISTLKSLL